MNQKGIAVVPVIAIIAGILMLGLVGYFVFNVATNSNENTTVACTTEAKVCPDGSAVGRTGPNCEFAMCPTVNTNATAGDGCVITGCNSEVCSNEAAVSACVVLPQYACYKTARCEKQTDGTCGWTQTEELITCISTYTSKSNTTTNSNTNTTATTSLRVRFVNSQTQAPIVNASVDLYTDNGIRCVTEPCPTNGRSWQGTTDSQGVVGVPASVVDESMMFTLQGYQANELHTGGKVQNDGSWRFPLIPNGGNTNTNKPSLTGPGEG